MAEAFLFLFLSGEEKTENEKPGEMGELAVAAPGQAAA
jgi:hypothetical protein